MACRHEAMVGKALTSTDVTGCTEHSAALRIFTSIQTEPLELVAPGRRRIIVSRDPSIRAPVAGFAANPV
jgi:hypothetical protein